MWQELFVYKNSPLLWRGLGGGLSAWARRGIISLKDVSPIKFQYHLQDDHCDKQKEGSALF